MDMPRPVFHPTPFGNYLLLERIGSGGMAEIFRAKTFGAAGFEKEYAIKRILPNLGADSEFVTMFINEAKLVVDLYHANIVQVFDLGEIDAAYFIAMEFVHGKDLLDLLARCAENDLKIPLKLVLFIMMEMLKGLDFAHKATDKFGEPLHIIHRDVSPSNIMLSYAGDVRVGDFGVAKARTQTHLTEVGTLKGKVGYMSPEQVRGEEIDPRSDVFAAGIILYESLTMSRLFMGGSDLDVMLKVRDADIEDELQRCKKVPPSLLDILRRALAKSRDVRFQSCEEFYIALRDFAYAHEVKTSNRDLSSFLARVFRDEIEAEKARRRGDPTSPPKPVVRAAAPATKGGRPSARKAKPPPEVVPDPEPLGDVPTGESRETVYRFRDAADRLYGPMTLQELLVLLSTQPESEEEAVAVGDGPWRSVDDVPQLWQAERAEPTEEDVASASQVPGANGSMPPRGPGTIRAALIPTHQGRLGRVSLARLLFRLVRRRASGMLRIDGEPHHKELFLRKGEPVLVTSSMREELLGNYLLRRRAITETQLSRALDRLNEFGGRLGDALVGERILPAHDLFRYLAEQVRDRVLDIFTWSQAEWSYLPDAKAPHWAVPLGVSLTDLILDGVRQHVSKEGIRAHFEGREDDHLEVAHSRVAIEDIPFSPIELDLANAVAPGLTPLELVDALSRRDGASEEMVWRVIYLLTEFELFRLGNSGEDGALP